MEVKKEVMHFVQDDTESRQHRFVHFNSHFNSIFNSQLKSIINNTNTK